MRRLRAGAYCCGDYLVRYLGWLGEAWDGKREDYRPWHVYRRSSALASRLLLERLGSLEEAKQFVAAQLRQDEERS